MNDFLPMITERDGIPVTTSRAVAEQFGKLHKDVIWAIENTIATLQETEEGEDFNRRNFAPISQRDAMNREQPAYILTRDGFTLLAMGFTGAKAMQFKVAYINAFNRMETLLRGGIDAEALQRIERRLDALDQKPAHAATSDLPAIFLQAIQQAIDSGIYYIRPRYKHAAFNVPDGMELLGVYDRHEIFLFSVLAYKIYATSVSNPVPVRNLWLALSMSGTILPREEAIRIHIIPGKSRNTIGLSRDKLRQRLRKPTRKTRALARTVKARCPTWAVLMGQGRTPAPRMKNNTGGIMMEERTIDQLPIESLDGMIKWYEKHLIFCMKHELICFEHAYHEAVKQYPAFMLSNYTKPKVEM